METQIASPRPQSFARHWLRVMRPLLWWFLLVLVLYSYRKHVQWSERTRIRFSVSLEGKEISYEVAGTLDDKPVRNGERIKLFRTSRFVVTHPKGESFSTNFFVWYGQHDFGKIDLKRTRGTLKVEANPPAEQLMIRGPEYSVVLTNSSGLTETVPTDRYIVFAKYPYWEKEMDISVYTTMPGTAIFAPRLGTLEMACSHSASYQLQALGSDHVIESGEFSFRIAGLPAGKYSLIAQHHGHERREIVDVKAETTNSLKLEFLYGVAVLETTPTDASVRNSAGYELGTTPLTITELQPGTSKFILRREGYEPVLATLNIEANQTNTFRTNLLNTSYLGAISAARRFLAAKEFAQAYEAANEALRIQPNDVVGKSLLREAVGWGNHRLAQDFGKKSDFIAGVKKLELALEALPQNEEINRMLVDYKRRVPEQIERQKKERLERPKKLFEIAISRTTDGSLFESNELTTSMPFNEVAQAIQKSFRGVRPQCLVNPFKTDEPETFAMRIDQEFFGGMRRIMIGGGQTKDDETKIYFKVMEYKTKHRITLEGGLTDNVEHIPVHESRINLMTEKLQNQIKDGIQLATTRIQIALGQTSEFQPSTAETKTPGQ